MSVNLDSFKSDITKLEVTKKFPDDPRGVPTDSDLEECVLTIGSFGTGNVPENISEIFKLLYCAGTPFALTLEFVSFVVKNHLSEIHPVCSEALCLISSAYMVKSGDIIQ